MKTIYIARHAKSSWKNKQITDVDRPLKPGGIIALQKISERLKNTAPGLDAIYTSPAVRATHTALIHARYLDFPENGIEIRNSQTPVFSLQLTQLLNKMKPLHNFVYWVTIHEIQP